MSVTFGGQGMLLGDREREFGGWEKWDLSGARSTHCNF